MLCVVGDLVEDVVVRPAELTAHGSDTPAVIERRRGGSAANVAVAAAAAGCPTRFIGRVGDDQLGRQLIEALADADVDVDGRVQCGRGRTGCVVVLVGPDGERSMFPDRAAAIELTAVDPTWLDGVTALHAPAYSLCAEPIGTTTRAMVHQVRARWGRISVDVSSTGVVRAYGVERFVDLVRALGPDIVFANRDEGELVGALDVPLMVVKRGADPVELRHGDGRVELVPVEPLAVVGDTTGAGDAFAGGYLAAVHHGAIPRVAATAGAAAAAQALRALGAE